MINPIVKTIELPDGRTITLETGKLAKQADGSVMLRMGNTMLLATVCAAKDAVPGTDFMPLQVEYKEKFAAFGRFPGGFTKREGRASDYEILTCRLVDRALRPLFPDNYHAEVYVNIILFSADGVDMPDALAGLAASAALAVSDIPFASYGFSFDEKWAKCALFARGPYACYYTPAPGQMQEKARLRRCKGHVPLRRAPCRARLPFSRVRPWQ